MIQFLQQAGVQADALLVHALKPMHNRYGNRVGLLKFIGRIQGLLTGKVPYVFLFLCVAVYLKNDSLVVWSDLILAIIDYREYPF